MGDLLNLRTAFRDALAVAAPTRHVTRDLRDFADRDEGDLLDGVLTVIGQGEKDFVELLGRMATESTVPMIVVGQIKVAEACPPSAVEDAEDALLEELKTVCRAGLAGFGLRLLSWRQSGQIEHPYGWFVTELEILT